jgi:flavin reductase (DIM6/NTAB) family NADH-FMN oxidoreductase RutF
MHVALGGKNILYPMPVTIVGALVDGKPNFINVAHVGILNAAKPHLVSLGMSKSHWTNRGIRQNRTLSINILSRDHIVEVDWMGLVSGKDEDKSSVFGIRFGALENAPIIEEAQLAMECRLRDVYDIGTHDVFIAEVVESWASEEVLVEGKPDMSKVKPILFDMSGPSYYAVGEKIGRPWSIGKQYRKSPN